MFWCYIILYIWLESKTVYNMSNNKSKEVVPLLAVRRKGYVDIKGKLHRMYRQLPSFLKITKKTDTV